MRPTLCGNRQAVSAGHYLAAAAGHEILEAGGNAIDAGCCAGMALAVLHADEVDFAGVAPIIIRLASGEVVTIAGLGHWPKSIPADLFMREHGGQLPTGVLRTVVPAAPDAWITALKHYGTMSFGEVAQAAIEYARDGFSIFQYLASAIEHGADSLRKWPSNAKVFLPEGRPLQLGERLKQTDLAATIQFMADAEAAASKHGREAGLEAARAAFYKGDIADQIVAHMKDYGGYLSRDDLANFHSPIGKPISGQWRDFSVFTCGPWCQGPTLIQCLTLMETLGLKDMRHADGEYHHLIIEAMKCVFADREYYYADPDHVDVPLDWLHSDENATAWAKRISRDQAMPEMPVPNRIDTPMMLKPTDGIPDRDPDTSYLCAIDRWGNAFSATPSDGGFRSPMVQGLGIIPSPRGMQSRPDPTHPSGVGPGRRPRLTPNPAIALRDDGTVVAFGAPGGDAQVQAMLQVFLNIYHFGMGVQEAIDAPRVITHNFPSSFYPNNYFPGYVSLESRVSAQVQDVLAARGHRLDLYPAYTRNCAAVELIAADPVSGFLSAGADPRQPAYAIVR
jgi:gamma-glutamyltranspeptidase/glutathione hydrolase